MTRGEMEGVLWNSLDHFTQIDLLLLEKQGVKTLHMHFVMSALLNETSIVEIKPNHIRPIAT